MKLEYVLIPIIVIYFMYYCSQFGNVKKYRTKKPKHQREVHVTLTYEDFKNLIQRVTTKGWFRLEFVDDTVAILSTPVNFLHVSYILPVYFSKDILILSIAPRFVGSLLFEKKFLDRLQAEITILS